MIQRPHLLGFLIVSVAMHACGEGTDVGEDIDLAWTSATLLKPDATTKPLADPEANPQTNDESVAVPVVDPAVSPVGSEDESDQVNDSQDFISTASEPLTSAIDETYPVADTTNDTASVSVVEPVQCGADLCTDDEYCARPVGECSDAGVCTALPSDDCEELPTEVVCGCGGEEYINECQASHVGVSVAHLGECSE